MKPVVKPLWDPAFYGLVLVALLLFGGSLACRAKAQSLVQHEASAVTLSVPADR